MSIAHSLNIVPPANSTIGAEILGIDLNELQPDSPEVLEIWDSIYRYRLVVFRDQKLSEQQYVDFARKIGRPQVYFQTNYHHPEHPEIFVSSNVLENGKKVGVSGTGHYWHTDCSFEPKPLSLTSVFPQLFPEDSRGTMYTDMVQIYNKLPSHLRSYVDGAIATHAGQLRYKVQATDIDRSLKDLLERINREVPPVKHPAVIVHPVTGEKSLYLNSGFTVALDGLTYEQNQKCLAELFEFIEQPEHVHNHLWRKGDLIVWDNRTLNHMSSPVKPGQQNKMYRIGIYDNQPFYVGIEA
jgi:taurine dioxygenase